MEKIAEKEKIAGELQKSLEQKEERMNGMQRKIEVCNKGRHLNQLQEVIRVGG